MNILLTLTYYTSVFVILTQISLTLTGQQSSLFQPIADVYVQFVDSVLLHKTFSNVINNIYEGKS